MFDWNDEEITNIIWDEARESVDHIVPCPDGSESKPSGLYGDQTRKERNKGAEDVKPAEQKKPVARTDSLGVKLESNSQYDGNENLTAKCLPAEPWPDISVSNVAKTDLDSMGTEASKSLTRISKHESSMHGETSQLSNCPEIFQNQQDGEQGDFVDYGWANIGSFDDLDRIFSNDDPIFGHASLRNADVLWSSSKDLARSPEKSIPLSFDSSSVEMVALRSTSDQYEIKSECILNQDHYFASGYGNMNNIRSKTPQDLQESIDTMGYTGGNAKPSQKEKTALEVSEKMPAYNSQLCAGPLAVPDNFMEKGNRQKGLLKTQVKSGEKTEVREVHEICSTWSASGIQFQQFGSHCAPAMGLPCSPLLMSQQRQLSGFEPSQYKHLPGPFLASSGYANMATHYPPMSVLSQLHPGKCHHQKVALGCEVSPGISDPLNKLSDASMKPLPMTPQEKIEKLRRRQQMRAKLAIQKQLQHFDNQVIAAESPIMEVANTEVEENQNILPTIDPNSPVGPEAPNPVCIPSDDCSTEDSILYQLQDIIGKVDIRIRLCIRDSLYRLAQSSIQRKYANDTSSNNRGSRDEVFNKGESYSNNRFARMPDVETETNSIDRTVAHLLFHRPLLSSGKNVKRPGSHLPVKLCSERNEAGSMGSPGTYMPQSESKQLLSHDESKVSFSFCERVQSKGSLSVDSSEDASKNEAADGAVLGAEASL